MTRYLPIALFVLALAISGFFIVYASPSDVVQWIGIENAYALMFAIAALGGMTTFNAVPYYSVVLLLASAGVNPFFLGVSSALGVMAGDSFSYLMGRTGSTAIPQFLRTVFDAIRSLAERYPRAFPFVCFAYGSLSPLSNDFITITGGIARIPYLRIMVPLAMGNIVFNVALAYLSVYASSFIRGLIE